MDNIGACGRHRLTFSGTRGYSGNAVTRLHRNTSALCLLILIVLCCSVAGSAADERLDRLPEKYRNWVEKEIVYIISDRERNAFLDLQSVAEWDAFIDAFWRRRDPDTLTPVNEFKEEHYRRIEFANRQLGRESAVPGWMTDRGKMLIILGDPDDRETFRSVGWLYPTEVWFYLQNMEKNLPPLYLLFFQEGFAGPYRLYNHLLDGPEKLMPAQQLNMDTARAEAYDMLKDISPDLAHASVNIRADEGAYLNVVQPDRAGLDFQTILSDIYESPYRRLDTRYVDAARDARGLVESEYLFNYIPSAAVADVIPGPAGTSFVHYSIEIDPQHMTLAKDGNTYYTSLELKGQVTTEDETIIYQFTKEPFLSLTESQFLEVNARPFSYRDMFPVAGGEFIFRLVFKNKARSEYTIFETPLQVEEISDAPFLGNPVLLNRAAELSDPEASGVYRTYQIGSIKLEPNTKRVYTIGQTLVALIPVENAKDGSQVSLRVVSREGPAQELVTKNVSLENYRGAPVVESIDLEKMAGGRYQLVADLLDSSGEVLSSRSADFDITPRSTLLRPWVMRESIDGEKTAFVRAALAEQYLVLGEVAKARELCQKALEENPNLIAPRIVLGRYHLDEKRPVEAIKLLEPAHAQSKDNVEILLTLGDAHFQVENYQRAADLFEAALVLRRPTPAHLNALAASYAQMGDSEKALQYLERSLEIDPEQEEAKTLLEKLQSP